MPPEAPTTTTLPQADHDLLIRVDTTLGHLRDDVKVLNDTIKTDINALKRDKLDRSENEQWKKDSYVPLEKTVSEQGRVQTWQSRLIWMGLGALALLELLLKWSSSKTS